MYCNYCGKELTEGGECTCEKSRLAKAEKAENMEKAAAELFEEKPIAEKPSFADSAKEAVKNAASHPAVQEGLYVFINALKDPVKEAKNGAERKGRLWIGLGVIEAVVTAIALTVFTVCSVNYSAKSVTSFLGTKSNLFDFELTMKLFFTALISSAVVYAVWALLLKGAASICKASFTFTAHFNMLASANAAPTVFMLAAAVIAPFYPPLSALLIAAALMLVVTVPYLGMQRLGKFGRSPLWFYIGAFIITLLIVIVCVRAAASMVTSHAASQITSFLNL